MRDPVRDSVPRGRLRVGAALALVGLVVAFVAVALAPRLFPGAFAVNSPFAATRPLQHPRDEKTMAAIVEWVRQEADCSEYYVHLPREFTGRTAGGSVSCRGGAVFLPQWAGIPDDAGGYWYSAGESPEGRDMWGMVCRDPVDLGDGWWTCGMGEMSSGHVTDNRPRRPSFSEALPGLVGLAMAAVFFAAGRLFRWIYGRAAVKVRRVEATWVQVPAVITHSEARASDPFEMTERMRQAQRSRLYLVRRNPQTAALGYVADIEYAYAFDGVERSGYRVGLCEDFTASGADGAIDRYPVGQRAVAWVNPEDPSEAVLEPAEILGSLARGATWVPRLMYVVATVALVSGLVSLVLAWL